METQKELIMNFLSDSNTIPVFISGRKFTHKKCYEISNYLFRSLRNLMEPKILTEKEVRIIYSDSLDYINEMFDTEPTIGMEYFIMVSDIIEFYKIQAVNNELYETAENLNKFIELYEQIKKDN